MNKILLELIQVLNFRLYSFVKVIGNSILLLSSPKPLLQIEAPLFLHPLFKVGKQIVAPIPFLQIEAPKTLLICEPSNEVSVYLHEYDKGLRCLILHLINPDLEDHKSLLEGIFTAITTHEAFINFGNFKSVIVSAVMYKEMSEMNRSSVEYNFHHNVLIDSTTTFNQYYNEVGDLVNHKLEHGYGSEVIESYKVKVWNLDLMKNSKIKLHNKGKIDFSGYVNKMYNLRLAYGPNNPLNLIAKLLLNSLYGKFGMKTDLTKVEVFDISTNEGKAALDKAIDTYGEGINSSIRIDNTIIIVRDSLIDLIYNNDDDFYHGANVNVAIASTITSAGRVFMSIFKNRSEFNLYYSDTDSAVIDAPLPSSIIGNGLGQLKLEHVISRAVFLAPKVYGIITEDGQEVIKVKGLSPSDLHIGDLEVLLVKDSTKEFTQEKWFKKTIEGEITVTDVAYTLKVTSNKRAPIYVDGVYQDTKPYNYEDIINK